MKTGVFVTGTDTNIGKTVVSALLVKAYRKKAKYWKPIQTGLDDDTTCVTNLADLDPDTLPRPAALFKLPAAPWLAAQHEGLSVDVAQILSVWHCFNSGIWVVEGAGGLLVPISDDFSMADLAKAIGLPLLVVVSTRLGCINHTLLTLEAAYRREIPVAGIVLNGPSENGLAQTLERLGGTRVLAEIPSLSLEPGLPEFDPHPLKEMLNVC